MVVDNIRHLKTWTIWLDGKQNDAIWNASLESAKFYNETISYYRKAFDAKEKPTMKGAYDVTKKLDRVLLHSQTAEASREIAIAAIQTFFKTLKRFTKSKDGFSGRPKFPYRSKHIFGLTFKKSAIRVKNGNIVLSMAKGKPPLLVPWEIGLPEPRMVKICMTRGRWKACVIIEDKRETSTLDKTKTLAVDLGVKRLATTFDGKDSIIISGKPILSLNRLAAKNSGKRAALLRKFKVGSRKHRKIKRSFNEQSRKIDDLKRDFLHKTSTAFVKDCHEKGIGKIVFGDCAGTHNSPNFGRINNQKISSGCEQKFRKYVEHKFQGVTDLVSESYTSQTCPVCAQRKKSSTRVWKCDCGFKCDRDWLGAFNIYNVSLGTFGQPNIQRSGDLATPRGLRFDVSASYCKPSIASATKRTSDFKIMEYVS